MPRPYNGMQGHISLYLRSGIEPGDVVAWTPEEAKTDSSLEGVGQSFDGYSIPTVTGTRIEIAADAVLLKIPQEVGSNRNIWAVVANVYAPGSASPVQKAVNINCFLRNSADGPTSGPLDSVRTEFQGYSDVPTRYAHLLGRTFRVTGKVKIPRYKYNRETNSYERGADGYRVPDGNRTVDVALIEEVTSKSTSKKK